MPNCSQGRPELPQPVKAVGLQNATPCVTGRLCAGCVPYTGRSSRASLAGSPARRDTPDLHRSRRTYGPAGGAVCMASTGRRSPPPTVHISRRDLCNVLANHTFAIFGRPNLAATHNGAGHTFCLWLDAAGRLSQEYSKNRPVIEPRPGNKQRGRQLRF